jgi:hypothetical protein
VVVGALEEARTELRQLAAAGGAHADDARALLARLPSNGAVTVPPDDAGSHPGRTS